MRAAYGTRFGISVTLAPDYWYLRWFDAKAMEPNVDFFGFMAYGKTSNPKIKSNVLLIYEQIFMALGIRMFTLLAKSCVVKQIFAKSATTLHHCGSTV